MPQTTQHGGCHCGAVRYTVEIDMEAPGVTCNCSMCSRAGTILSFVGANQFKLEQGADALGSYQFNRKHVDHLFCKTCGIKSFARGKNQDGKEMVAVNLRCIDDVDVSKLNTQAFDGKSL